MTLEDLWRLLHERRGSADAGLVDQLTALCRRQPSSAQLTLMDFVMRGMDIAERRAIGTDPAVTSVAGDNPSIRVSDRPTASSSGYGTRDQPADAEWCDEIDIANDDLADLSQYLTPISPVYDGR